MHGDVETIGQFELYENCARVRTAERFCPPSIDTAYGVRTNESTRAAVDSDCDVAACLFTIDFIGSRNVVIFCRASSRADRTNVALSGAVIRRPFRFGGIFDCFYDVFREKVISGHFCVRNYDVFAFG
jgi:hypothetical protein